MGLAGSGGEWGDIHGDGHLGFASTDDHASEGADVTKVASPSHGDVAIFGEEMIGGIGIDPPEVRRPSGDPGVGGIGPDEAGFSGRREGF